MAALEYDYKTGTYVPVEEEEGLGVKPMAMSYQPAASAVKNPQQEMLDRSAAEAQKKDVGILPNGVGWIGDTIKTGANVVAGMGTGIVDLGLMAVDAARASTGDFGGLTQGARKSALGWDEVGESRDNPLTAARIKYLTPDSEAFKVVSYMGEVASWFVNPKGVLRLAGRAATLGRAGKATAVGRASGDLVGGLKALAMGDPTLSGLIKGARKISGALGSADEVSPGIQAVQKAFKTGELQAGSRVDDFVKLMAGENPLMRKQMQSALQNSMSANPLTRRLGFIATSAADTAGFFKAAPIKQKLHMVGEFVVKDMYANFMTTGTRELSEEESGISRWVSQQPGWGMIGAAAQSLVPLEQDAALVARAKMVGEGTILNLLTQPLIDTARLGWMARKLDLADLDHRQQVLRILNAPELAGDLVVQKVQKATGAVADAGAEQAAKAAPTLDDLRAQRESMQQELNTSPGLLGEIPDLERINAGKAPKPQWEDANEKAAQGEYDQWEQGINDRQAAQQQLNTSPVQLGELIDLDRINAGKAPKPAWGEGTRPEPVFSPGALRSAAENELSTFMAGNTDTMTTELLAWKVEEVGGKLMALMPQSRQSKVDYLKQFTPMVNRAGIVQPIDGIWYSALVRQGMDEGWAKIDDEWSSFSFNRQAALEVEESEQIFRLADEMDRAAADKRLLEGPAASEQTVDVQAQAVPDEAPQLPAGAAPEPAPVEPMTTAVPPEVQGVAAADAKVGLAEQDLAATQAEAASRQAPAQDMPTEVMGQEPAEQAPSIADMFQRQIDLAAAVDQRAQANTKARLDRIKGLVGELGAEDGALPTGQTAKALPAEAINPEEVAAKEAADAAGLEQSMRDQSYEPVPLVIPPKLTDAVTVQVKNLGQGQMKALKEVLSTTDYKFKTGTSTAEIGSKAVGDVIDFLEDGLKNPEDAIFPPRTASSLATKLRETLAQNAVEINQQSTVDDLVSETQSMLFNGEICDLGGML